MKTRLLLLPLALVLVAALVAGCGGGGGSTSVPPNAVAVVGSTPIPKSTYNSLIALALALNKAHGQAAPKPGSAAYTQLGQQMVTYLVQQEELQQEAAKLGVTVTDQDVAKRIALIKKTYFHGSDRQFQAALKKDGMTLGEYEQYDVRRQLLSEKIYNKVTASDTVSTAVAQSYYTKHKALYGTPPTREVRHILVSTKSLADQLEAKLKHGASFAALAKKYSKDTVTGKRGGKLCVAHDKPSGACEPTVPPFDKAAFSLKTGEISQPVHSMFGWHIIQALAPVKPGGTPAFSKVEAQIKAQLSQTKKSATWTAWLAKLKNDYQNKVSYQTGYKPVTTTTPTVSTQTTTTG